MNDFDIKIYKQPKDCKIILQIVLENSYTVCISYRLAILENATSYHYIKQALHIVLLLKIIHLLLCRYISQILQMLTYHLKIIFRLIFFCHTILLLLKQSSKDQILFSSSKVFEPIRIASLRMFFSKV